MWTLLTVPQFPLKGGNGVPESPQRGGSPGLRQVLSSQDLCQLRKSLQRPSPSTAGQEDMNPTVRCIRDCGFCWHHRKRPACVPCCQTSSELLMSHESFPAMLGILGVCLSRMDRQTCITSHMPSWFVRFPRLAPLTDCNTDQGWSFLFPTKCSFSHVGLNPSFLVQGSAHRLHQS